MRKPTWRRSRVVQARHPMGDRRRNAAARARLTVLRANTWTCHICGDERPDALIEVYSEEHPICDGRATFQVNVRYCADRQACRYGAPAIARGWAAPVLDAEVAV